MDFAGHQSGSRKWLYFLRFLSLSSEFYITSYILFKRVRSTLSKFKRWNKLRSLIEFYARYSEALLDQKITENTMSESKSRTPLVLPHLHLNLWTSKRLFPRQFLIGYRMMPKFLSADYRCLSEAFLKIVIEFMPHPLCINFETKHAWHGFLHVKFSFRRQTCMIEFASTQWPIPAVSFMLL